MSRKQGKPKKAGTAARGEDSVGNYPVYLGAGVALLVLGCALLLIMVDLQERRVGGAGYAILVFGMFAALGAGLGCLTYGCREWAASRGHPRRLGWLALAGVLGLVVLYFMLKGEPTDGESAAAADGQDFYCQVCRRRPAHAPDGKAYTVCSEACGQEFGKMHLANLMQGRRVYGAPDDMLATMNSARTWKYCKHCGQKMQMLAKVCDGCGGDHPM